MIPIFDFDGTIVDSLEAHGRFYYDFAQLHGIQLDKDHVRRTIRDPNVSSRLFQIIGIPDELVKEMLEKYKVDFKDYPQPLFPGVLEMLQLVRKRQPVLCLATFNFRANVLAHGRDILGLFDTVITQDEARRKHLALTGIIDKYRLSPEEYVLVGDTSWDYDSSREAGIKFIGVSWGWHNLQHNSQYEVAETVSELGSKIINKL